MWGGKRWGTAVIDVGFEGGATGIAARAWAGLTSSSLQE